MLTENTVFIRAISTILASIAQSLGARAVAIPALELPQTAEAVWAQVWFIRTIRAVFLAITFPPYGDTLFIVATQELRAGAHGHAECSVSKLNGLEVIGTRAGESSPPRFDEAQMRTATVVGTTGIAHNRLPVWMVHVDVEGFVRCVHQHHST